MYNALVVANTSEAFLPLINRFGDGERNLLLAGEHRLGDRALFWGMEGKVVVTSLPASHVEYLTARLSYRSIMNVFPTKPSAALSRDIVDDGALLSKICNLVRGREIDLLSYVVSDELVALVSAFEHRGILVRPENMSSVGGLGVGRCFDTKSGFRKMCLEWALECPSLRIPRGWICETPGEAASRVAQLLDQGRACVCKADRGESGIGLLWVQPSELRATPIIESRLHANPAFGDDPIVVEEVISQPGSNAFVSPSVEAYVSKDGEVRITYSCLQLCDARGAFAGVLIDAHSLNTCQREQIEVVADVIGQKLAGLGYVGHFDLDFVLDRDGVPYVLEGNARRTGGTHVHEAASFLVGTDYHRSAVILARDEVQLARTFTFEQMLDRVRAYLFPIAGEPKGVVPTVVAGLGAGLIGYIVFASTATEAIRLEAAFLACLGRL